MTSIYQYKCPKCGRFTGEGMECACWTFGETTGMPYLYCDEACYEAMEFPWEFQQKKLHEE